MVKSVCLSYYFGWRSLGYWVLVSRKDSRTKDYGFSCRLLPSQDAPSAFILWYVEKTIYSLLE